MFKTSAAHRWSLPFAIMAGVLFASITPASAGGVVRLDDLSQQPAIKPATFTVTYHADLVHLHWSKWGGQTASAQGTLRINTCRPDCATGRVHNLPTAELQVRRVQVDSDGRQYYRQYRILDRLFTPSERNTYSHWTSAYVPSDFN